jgi:hypothetical protein
MTHLAVTADDVRVLAQQPGTDPVLAIVDGQLRVVPAGDASGDAVVYTKADLVTEYGEEITDVEAETLAGALTARLAH